MLTQFSGKVFRGFYGRFLNVLYERIAILRSELQSKVEAFLGGSEVEVLRRRVETHTDTFTPHLAALGHLDISGVIISGYWVIIIYIYIYGICLIWHIVMVV